MIKAKAELIREIVEEQTGATIVLDEKSDGIQKGLDIRFGDLTRNEGPLVTLRPSGLRRHLVTLRFGSYSASVIEQISHADDERMALARALVCSINKTALVSFPEGMDAETWFVDGASFTLKAERKVQGDRQSAEEIIETCRSVVAPIMASLAELIGYEEVSPPTALEENSELEGAVTVSTVRRRERNPRNRLLCLRLRGYACVACGTDPRDIYGTNGSVIEVHHLQPLSQIHEPRAYDPKVDLVPLCPTCHRVVHSRRPVPWSPTEVKEMMNG
tara:strand:- start:4196 stop:5017 length:822 start_codon:yes stop_codon:yes gene_type:complete